VVALLVVVGEEAGLAEDEGEGLVVVIGELWAVFLATEGGGAVGEEGEEVVAVVEDVGAAEVDAVALEVSLDGEEAVLDVKVRGDVEEWGDAAQEGAARLRGVVEGAEGLWSLVVEGEGVVDPGGVGALVGDGDEELEVAEGPRRGTRGWRSSRGIGASGRSGRDEAKGARGDEEADAGLGDEGLVEDGVDLEAGFEVPVGEGEGGEVALVEEDALEVVAPAALLAEGGELVLFEEAPGEARVAVAWCWVGGWV
jgi:hypothetical protein